MQEAFAFDVIEDAADIHKESLTRATQGQSIANYPAIIKGFAEMGIPETEINPRENVFTFNAWKALGRSVMKGQHGVKVFTFAESTNKETGERSRRPWSTTVFHISQTKPIDGSEDAPKLALVSRPAVEPAVRIPQGAVIAERFRKWADAMQPKIDHAGRPMTQNPTPKRNREYQGRMHDCRNMERTQRGLRALADAYEAGNVPACLGEIKTRDEVRALVYKGTTGGGGYYSVIECDDYRDTTEAGRTLQGMIDGNSAQRAERERLRQIEALKAEIALSSYPGFFPSPMPVVAAILARAQIEDGMRVLEPSAGSGNIADEVRKRFPYPSVSLSVCECVPKLCELLKLKGHILIGSDFFEVTGEWDRIVMNPPFEKQADLDHIRQAYSLLAPDGVMVSVLSPSFEFRSDWKSTEFREWLETVSAEWENLPDGSFKESGTGVSTRLLVIHK